MWRSKSKFDDILGVDPDRIGGAGRQVLRIELVEFKLASETGAREGVPYDFGVTQRPSPIFTDPFVARLRRLPRLGGRMKLTWS